MLNINQFNYHLKENLIAQKPIYPRDSSRLLKLDKESGQIKHYSFADLAELLDENVVLVRNNSKVIPARIFGQKASGAKVEILLLKKIEIEKNLSSELDKQANFKNSKRQEFWECLTKPGLKQSQIVHFTDSELEAKCLAIEGYTRLIAFNKTGVDFFEELEKIGKTPIPPYIKWHESDEAKLKEQYQTTYAQISGSVAAPTAGLHFTKKLDEKLKARGVQIETVTLHVGLGTFQPVKTKNIAQHQMHSEVFSIQPAVIERLKQAKQKGKKIIAVGTTTTRVLETVAKNDLEGNKLRRMTTVNQNILKKFSEQQQLGEFLTSETDIFIYPPYQFKLVDALITNFHLPKSTLLMLVSAMVSQPNTDDQFTHFKKTKIGKAYQEAIKNHYRFYSFGDAMLII
ncbi:MAG: tRNA preQ1(34) S-adenosylmethionine ribosyltransferase-isomerase QueA [Candidatus Woesebacteria bacterium]|jgi:S-adenosylmethionine:tRNA ribosyltransferase-isomerase